MPVESHPVSARHQTVFEHAYPVEAPDLRSLYEKAKRDQWNAARDIAWTTPQPVQSAVPARALSAMKASWDPGPT